MLKSKSVRQFSFQKGGGNLDVDIETLDNFFTFMKSSSQLMNIIVP